MEGGGQGRGKKKTQNKTKKTKTQNKKKPKKKKSTQTSTIHLDESLNTAMESLSIYSLTVHWVPAAKRTKKMYPLQAQLLSF